MKGLLRVALILLLAVAATAVAFYLGLAGPEPLRPPARDDAVFDDVVLVEPGVGRRTHRQLVLEAGRIAAVKAAGDRGGPWSGAFVLPGLVDAHVHFPPPYLPGHIELFSFLFLRHGITGVRSLGDVAEGTSLRARAAEREAAFAGPRVATCGRFLDSAPPLWASIPGITKAVDLWLTIASLNIYLSKSVPLLSNVLTRSMP